MLLMGRYPLRNMVMHEYQAAQVLHEYRVPIPIGQLAFNKKEARVVARKFGTNYHGNFIVKA
jgi:succinyl-CoA synthetase beta subunit